MAFKNFIMYIHQKLYLNESELTFIIGRFSMSLLQLKSKEKFKKYFENRTLVSTKFMDEDNSLTSLIDILAVWSNERKSRLSIELQVKNNKKLIFKE